MTEQQESSIRQALEALEDNRHLIEEYERPEYLALYDSVISSVRKALEQPVPKWQGARFDSAVHEQPVQQEPVADKDDAMWVFSQATHYGTLSDDGWTFAGERQLIAFVRMVRTRPPARDPLTDEQCDAIMRKVGILANFETIRELIRATEAAHGITGEKK